MRQNSRSLPHVCFIAPIIFPVLSRDETFPVLGGAEVQQNYIARALQQKGYPISVITNDFGQPDDYELDGIRIIKIKKKGLSIPGLRYIYPRLTSIWTAMKKANADIYYQRCAGAFTGVASGFAQYHRKKFIFSAASDNDVLSTLPHFDSWRDRQLFTYGLKNADRVVIQNPTQEKTYRDWLGKQGLWIPSCYVTPDGAHANISGNVLWIGMMRPGKQPHLVLELAKRLPHLRFKLIGGVSLSGNADNYYQHILQESKKLPNVECLGFVPYAQIDPHFNAARLFINTSESEGFPNTFLQAWSRGIPTVSFVNCGSIDSEGSIGFIAQNLDHMEKSIDNLMTNDVLWVAEGHRCKNYFEANHSVDYTIDCYEKLILELQQKP